MWAAQAAKECSALENKRNLLGMKGVSVGLGVTDGVGALKGSSWGWVSASTHLVLV